MPGSVLRVLVVEDSRAESELVRHALTGHAVRFDLELVAGLGQALSALGRSRFDAVLLDLGLPDSEGLDTLSAVRAAQPDVKEVAGKV